MKGIKWHSTILADTETATYRGYSIAVGLCPGGASWAITGPNGEANGVCHLVQHAKRRAILAIACLDRKRGRR